MGITLFENDEIALVRPSRKKYANFTVKEIGGPNEIIQWRKERAKIELANLQVTMQKRENIKKWLSDGAPDGERVTWEGKASLTSAKWEEKLKEGLAKKKSYMQPEILDFKPRPTYIAPKVTLFQRFKSWLGSFWKSANF